MDRVVIVFGMAYIFGFGVLVGGTIPWEKSPAAAQAGAPAVDDGAWVAHRLEAVDRVCGPVPWTVKITRDTVEATCSRPENVGAVRVAKALGAAKPAPAKAPLAEPVEVAR